MFQENLKQFVEDNPKLVSMKPAGDGIRNKVLIQSGTYLPKPC